uniref:Transmembrane protein n=1 Tax=Cajanus cajan TaxID=3821 RepID=A0A151RFR3_CAJCA|nr:hypothetical protein KK1_037273 [Cajanus cajan]
MEKVYKQQIFSKLSSNLGTSPPIILVLVMFSFYFFFSISKSSFPFLLTIPIALLSTLFLVTLTKKKGSQNENLVQDELQKEQLHPSLDVTHADEVNQQSETAENHEQQAEAHLDYSFPTDSESSNFSIMDRTFELNADQEHRLHDDLQSDYSLPSDKDSLIEINLPSNHFSELTEDPKQKLQSKLPELLQDSLFKQQGLMELLAEINDMNEDENLIEIDISMGSGVGIF